MAFCDLKPVRLFDESSGNTYIIGEVFAVYSFGAELPAVYSWDLLEQVTEDKRSLIFNTGKKVFTVPKKLFLVMDDYFRAITIIESMQKAAGFEYIHQSRILPLKSSYMECAYSKDAYSGQGIIDENDAAATYVMMMNYKLVKLLWVIALIIMLVIFGVLQFTIGVTRDNLLYFIPISVAGGGIITLIVYLICHAVARGRYQSIAKCDPASDEVITFVISAFGFAACESCVYEGHDLVPWNEMDYFIETDKMFVMYKDGKARVYIPKKAFDKKQISGVADIMSLRLEQK